ncbi:hypothetical protein FBU30_007627 [Linnemannia zychae]|nr:hypothetical protein FBU30_007627 [Linnemannia zychae]
MIIRAERVSSFVPSMGATSIPVILELIAPYLNTHNLIACVQVNLLWNAVFTPHLWHFIDDSQKPWIKLVEQFKPTPFPNLSERLSQQDIHSQASTLIERAPDGLLDLFVKYGHHIRRMAIHRPQTVELCLRARIIVLNAQLGQKVTESTLAGLSTPLDNAIITTSSSTIAKETLHEKEGEETAISNDFLWPCENLKVLKICFSDAVLAFLKGLDCSDPGIYSILPTFSDTLCGHQRELELSLPDVHPGLFQKEHSADNNKLHLVTLARSCWQLVINNRYLQELDMGSFGSYENAFIPSSGFLKEVLASHPTLRTVRIGAERSADFLVTLPRTLPRLRMLWCHELATGTLNELVNAIDNKRYDAKTQAAAKDHFTVIERMPNLQLLDTVAAVQPRHLEAILTHFPALIMLSIGTVYLDETTTHSTTVVVHDDTFTRESLRHPSPLGTHLRELRIRLWKCPISLFKHENTSIHFTTLTRLFLQSIMGGYRNLLDLLRLLPSLQVLQLRKFVPPHSNLVESDYSREKTFTSIQSISLGKDVSFSYIDITGLLTLLPNLTEAILGSAYPYTSYFIADHCPHLEMLELRVDYRYGVYPDLDVILHRCTKLKSLIAPQCEIQLKSLMQKRLVCKDLQVLDCVITRIPRVASKIEVAMRRTCEHCGQDASLDLHCDVSKWPEAAVKAMNQWHLTDPNHTMIYSKVQEIIQVDEFESESTKEFAESAYEDVVKVVELF